MGRKLTPKGHSKRTKAGMRAALAQGKPLGPVPFGFDLGENGLLVTNPREQNILLLIRKWSQKRWPLSKIARRLNGDRQPAKNGGIWHPMTVSYVLKAGPKYNRAAFAAAERNPYVAKPMKLSQTASARSLDITHSLSQWKAKAPLPLPTINSTI